MIKKASILTLKEKTSDPELVTELEEEKVEKFKNDIKTKSELKEIYKKLSNVFGGMVRKKQRSIGVRFDSVGVEDISEEEISYSEAARNAKKLKIKK